MSETNSTNTHHPPSSTNPSSSLVYINVSAQAPLKLTADNYTAWHAQWYYLLISVLLTSLDPTIVNFIVLTASSREAWQNLATMYAKPSRGCLMSMRETLSKLTKDEKSISDYMQTIQSLVDSFTLTGDPLGQDEITFHILNGLGLEYKEIYAAI
ncbi:hypothetical protein FEM48_Zijuj08G0198300 [Ziziphus jujuba var. spinosa]|uniref:Retrotransposon Copia-like N-terminal domain-containing protein n=1 Tax=Ziziphus jujuba var. spinosa TaxID=714518 RepID=A0A978V117_ZIZJJ|nr:hypothetical protein FEM48_Zijuj08G0198300 [Ziziphus jujuba var. spinosa]